MVSVGRSFSSSKVIKAVVAVFIFLVASYFLWSWFEMKTLAVTIYVEEPLLSKGGTVNVITREMPDGEFDAKYDQYRDGETMPGGPEGKINLAASVRDRMNFVYFDTPSGGSYTYRFVGRDSKNRVEQNVLEKVLSVGGKKDPGEWGLNRAHMVSGPKISEAKARSYVTDPEFEPFKLTSENCRTETAVKVCVYDDAQMMEFEIRSSRTNGTEPVNPWEN